MRRGHADHHVDHPVDHPVDHAGHAAGGDRGSRGRALVAVLLPLLAVGLGIARAELHRARSQTFFFEVRGYDPRDPLRGHYIQFFVDYRSDLDASLTSCDEKLGQACCLCLTRRGERTPPGMREATCDVARARCDGAVTVEGLRGLRRYYVPEAGREARERRVRAAASKGRVRVEVDIDPDGDPVVRRLWDGSEPL